MSFLKINTEIMATQTPGKFSAFFAAFAKSKLAGNPQTREEVVFDFSGGRTTSLRELTAAELKDAIDKLNGKSIKYDRSDKMRKAIIAIFKKRNLTTQDAIAWAEKQGVKGVKKKFNDYLPGELWVLISIAEKIESDWQHSIRKNLNSPNNF